MTSLQQADKSARIEINFPEQRGQEWSTLAYLAFKKKQQKIGAVIGEIFGVEFETPTSQNSVTNPIRSVVFYGDPALQAKIETVLNVLLEDINRPPEARRHLNRAAVTEIATEVKDTGTYVPKVFIQTETNNNTRGSTAVRESTPAQNNMAHSIVINDLTFGIGPAGTGKTFVAMKAGIEALKEAEKAGKKMNLLLARPATEAGENIGFLPGTQEDKLAPYMRPLYDELDKAFGRAKWKKMMETGQIEVVPVGFMRGRTFDDAFIVIDEAQNLTQEQLEMAATRIGYNSKMVITGDPNQIDLKPKSLSALMGFLDIMRGEPSVGVQEFTGADCIRSKMAQTIVNAIAKMRAAQEEMLTVKAAPAAKETSTPKVKKPSRLVQAFTETAPVEPKSEVKKPAKKITTAFKATKSALEKAIPAPKGKGLPAAPKAKKKP